MTRNLLVSAGALVALALAGIADAGVSGTPGVSSSKITIGSSGPLTGEAAAAAGVLRGADAYFKYVNARGGVYGRKFDFKYLDDAYNPSQTVANVRQLVQQDNVFALFSIVGTNANLAVRDFTNAAARSTRGRSATCRRTRRRGRSTRARSSRRTRRRRRSACSTRATTTARTC